MTLWHDPRFLAPQERCAPPVLDFAPGAAAAYSLRSLSSSYTDPVVTVRRSTDDAEADFTASEVSDGTLAAWCGAGDGFVKQWWDQSGNARHATQAPTTAQPQIVGSGVLVTEGGKAALRFDGVGDRLVATFGDTFPQPVSIVSVSSKPGNAQYIYDGIAVGSRLAVFTSADGLLKYAAGVTLKEIPQVDGTHVLFVLFSGEDWFASTNGSVTSDGLSIGTDTLTGISIGARYTNVNFFSGTISELIIYPTDMTTLRERIEASMAWYF